MTIRLAAEVTHAAVSSLALNFLISIALRIQFWLIRDVLSQLFSFVETLSFESCPISPTGDHLYLPHSLAAIRLALNSIYANLHPIFQSGF